jgi:type I restriction enzyme S subunit
MSDWKPYKFSDAVECNPKISIKKGEIIENCEMEDIDPGYKFVYPRDGKLYKGSNSKFQNKDTVFARITPCLENGKIAQVRGLKTNKGIGSTEFFVFRGKKGISDTDFVYYLCKSNLVRDTAVNSMSGASGRQRADIKAVKKLDLLLPSLEAQQRIASILAAYDDLIEANNQRIKILEETASQMYKEWFVRLRFPGYKQTKFEKGIPLEWEVKKVKDAFEILGGGTPSTEKEEYWNGNINWFTPTDITGSSGIFLSEAENKITEKGLNKSSAKLFPPYSIMMTSRATIGAVGINTTAACTNQGFITCLPNKKLPFTFLYYWISSNKEIFETLASGSTFLEITKGTFKKIDILLPPVPVMQKYHETVEPLFKQIEIVQEQNVQLCQIRDRLLPRLISGKLKVKGISKELNLEERK